MNRRAHLSLLVILGLFASRAHAQVNVTATISLGDSPKPSKSRNQSNIVLWLTPSDPATLAVASREAPQHPSLVQINKSFQPHILVVPVGTEVAFPNHDPFFHNVFSLFEGKRFDLGLYEAGTSRDVLFDKPGISYIFCNIHAEMSAVVIALNTPYHGVSNRYGQVNIPHVPPGRYTLRVWYETATPDTLNAMTREVTIGDAH